MKQTISDLQKRRADNIIWTCAGDYSFVPDFKAYREDGSVDLYWNVIWSRCSIAPSWRSAPPWPACARRRGRRSCGWTKA